MTDREQCVESIFLAALEFASELERQAYLEDACRSKAELYERVMELLRAHEVSQGPLDMPLSHIGSQTASYVPAETVDTQVGPYKLLQVIGEGGMGIVYMAEQVEPIQRRVAIKIIKQGMDTRQFIARFEAERQALAMMDHPNIARVFDGGCTEAGRPYFVMELVKGVSS